MNNCIGLFYIKNDTELSKFIVPGMVCDKIRQVNNVTDLTGVIYIEKETELS